MKPQFVTRLLALALSLAGTGSMTAIAQPSPAVPGGNETLPGAVEKTATPVTPSSPQIVNGKPAAAGEIPWQGALLRRGADGNPNITAPGLCGVVFIRPRIALTAGHCVDKGIFGKHKEWSVVSGSLNLDDTAGMVTHDIEAVLPHPRYVVRGISLDYDVALIRLVQPFTGRTIDLLSSGDNGRVGVGTMLQVSGWGRTAEFAGRSMQLLKTDVPIVGRPDCNDADSYDGLLSSNMFCAGFPDGRTDSCLGDSGGPATAAVGPNGERRLVGIVSWGDGCGKANKYGVYVRLHALRGWINSAIDMLERND